MTDNKDLLKDDAYEFYDEDIEDIHTGEIHSADT